MKKVLSVIAAFALTAFITTSCGLTGSTSANPSTSGTTTGTALTNLFAQFLKDGRLDTSNLSNLINLATLATSIQSLKGNSQNNSVLGSFAAGLVNGSKNTITNTNSSAITNLLASLVNNTDISSLAALLTHSGEIDEQAAAEAQNTQAMSSTTGVLNKIFTLMGK